MPFPVSPDDAARVAALRALALLDTPGEERFDRITRLASDLLDVPIALVSLVDLDRQWFKSCVGLDTPSTPRDVSFCTHAILGDEIFVVPDATADPLFADNPLVTGPPHIRSYAGRPLRASGGERVGTLCVIDRRPRTLSRVELARLDDLGAWAQAELRLTELERVARELANLEQLREQVVATVSHEMRTPLTVLLGSIEALAEGEEGALSADQQQLADMALRNGRRLSALSDDLLLLARLEGEGASTPSAEVHLARLVEELAEDLRRPAGERGITIGLDVDDDVVVRGDPDRLRQAIGNLVGNAVKYSHDGDAVLVRLRCEAGSARVDVVDHGVGIPAAELGRIGERFFRSSLTADVPGTGLGLSITRQIAHAHGGRLEVASTEGEGSTFSLVLPVA